VRTTTCRLGLASLAAGLLLPVGAAGPAAAEVEIACDPDNDQNSASATPGRPFESLRIGEMQDWFEANRNGRLPGDGVVVAVLDSGVGGPVPLAAPQVNVAAVFPGAQYFHGTAVAGIIAGPPSGEDRIGIAPGAKILDIKIYDDDDRTDGSVAVSTDTVFAGLEKVEELLPTQPIKVVNLSVAVPDDVGVKAIIGRLWRKGVIVVASTGNRPGNPDDPLMADFGAFEAGENAAQTIFPAGYDDVVGATTTIGGLPAGEVVTNYILQSTAIDVAVPTSGALTYSPATGAPCVLKQPATSWAAAEVSGVLAALASAYPDEGPAQLVTRLEATASGRVDVPSPLTGAGLLQPYAAMTRPLTVDAQGGYDRTRPVQSQERAVAPEARADPLVSTRENMVWFGIVGGGVLVLALVLRPVLARRRRT
jgi:membrane-anchored mycosin MYCP